MKLLPYEERFILELYRHGINEITVNARFKIPKTPLLQSIFVWMMLNRADICYREHPANSKDAVTTVYRLLGGKTFKVIVKKEGPLNNYYPGFCDNPLISNTYLRSKLLKPIPYPILLIDLSLASLVDGEDCLEEAGITIANTLEIIRRFLYDKNLIVTGVNSRLKEEFYSMITFSDVNLTEKTAADTLWALGVEDVVILSPLANKPLSLNDINSTQAFVVPYVSYWDKRMTRYILNMVPWAKIRKLALKGDSMYIPHRPSFVSEVIFDVLFKETSIENAIIKRMKRKRIYRRLVYEVNKLLKNGETNIENIIKNVSWLTNDASLVKRAIEQAIEEIKGE